MPKSPLQAVEQAPPTQAPSAPIVAASAIASQTPDPLPTSNVTSQPVTADVPERVDHHLEAMAEAERENTKRGFMDKVMQARANQQPKPYTPPERPARIVQATNEEMAAGAALVAKRAAEDEVRKAIPKPKEKWEGDTAVVFRPSDYIPDPKKNQGHVQARPLPTR